MKTIQADLNAFAQIAEDMPSYLRSSQLYIPALHGNTAPTVGGYLVRQARLSKLMLSGAQQAIFTASQRKFEQAIADAPDAYQRKAAQERDSRLRQWGQSLGELLRDPSDSFYRTDVEKRALVAALLTVVPSDKATEKIRQLDQILHSQWRTGAFIWLEVWQLAYPQGEFWWLYGKIQLV